MKVKFKVDGMYCSACSAAVERVAKRVNGVTSARKKDYRRYDYRQKPRDNGYRILFLFFHTTLLDYNIPL